MQPTIITIPSKKLVGLSIKGKISFDDTKAMWQRFQKGKKEIENRVEGELHSMQIYPKGFKMEEFTEDTQFERRAAVEVSTFGAKPEGFEDFELAGGLYAKFIHKGPVRAFIETSNYIFKEWLPQSDYRVDDRAHFEILGAKYLGPEHPDSEEEIFIPLKIKAS
ncbi:MAG: GyrI-like domain-containing protein [Cytophagaceae bacterium]|nr:GyrI-like domain-containing protein [Cytophagaceae bacterium]